MHRNSAFKVLPLAALSWLALGLQAVAQAGLPATAPTAGASQPSVSQLPSAQVQDTGTVGGAAQPSVSWNGQLLRISGRGATLQQTLESVATATHIRVLGSIPSDRVYGEYGPAPLAVVIAALTDGLPINVLFVDSTGSHAPQLTLTARNGAATPPDTSLQQQAYEPPPSVQSARPPEQLRRNITTFGGAPASSTIGLPSGTANTNPAPETGSNAGDNPASPTGVKTPQEIFEQLQRLRAAAAANHQ